MRLVILSNEMTLPSFFKKLEIQLVIKVVMRRRGVRPANGLSDPVGLDSDDEAEAELAAATEAADCKREALHKLYRTLSTTPAAAFEVESALALFTLHPNWIDADIAGRGVKQTALHTACGKHGHAAVVQWLLEHGANPDSKTISGNRPLHYACRNGHFECVKLLLDTGAAAAPKNVDGLTPEDSICKAPSADAVAAAQRIRKILIPASSAALAEAQQNAAAAAALAEAKHQTALEARKKENSQRWDGEKVEKAAAAAVAGVDAAREEDQAFAKAHAERATEWKDPHVIGGICVVGLVASAAASWTYIRVLSWVTKNRPQLEATTDIYWTDSMLSGNIVLRF